MSKKTLKKIEEKGLQTVARQRNFSLMILSGARTNIKHGLRYFIDDEDIKLIDDLFDHLERKVKISYYDAKKSHKSQE